MQNERNGTLDHARLIAAFGIVVFHAGAPGAAAGYAGLPFFLILLTLLAVPGARRLSFGGFARGRARRLLCPWLVWSGVYGLLKLAEIAVTGAPLASEFAPYMLLTGPALHLWFLPFAFAVCLAAYPVMRLSAFPPCGVFFAMALAALLLQQGQALPTPAAQWLYGMPAICVGLGLALGGGGLRMQALMLAALGIAALCLGATAGLLQLMLAAAAILLCRALPRPATALSRQAAQAALGVYLVHPLILSLLERAGGLAPHSAGLALAGCAGALLAALAILHAPAALRGAAQMRAGAVRPPAPPLTPALTPALTSARPLDTTS